MAIGDLTSDAKGSGARFNDGKAPYELIAWQPLGAALHTGTRQDRTNVRLALCALGEFQAGGREQDLADVLLYAAAAAELTMPQLYAEIARVLEYGKFKYAEWNWAKGMSWNAVIACAARHLLGTAVTAGMWDDPLGVDPDSGLMHVGHLGCNVMMLLQFMRTYPEGDDRPKDLVMRPF